ncbi:MULTISPECIES: hypothetical protein [unclassified Arthrobacter]|uniref:hypothetical protein n=1 Tax=unclassified Arthrobacter TaxID=235627 RepID=UPI002DF83235|nr:MULTISPECIES: hypothetical protein [unclassified Arthrobacter]MEC5191390.1 hypothetical protein [Arthrobacter sp. MP_M4]MEC5202973.1 hypothetical protein [Arthrobacter sp. MP_M7]
MITQDRIRTSAGTHSATGSPAGTPLAGRSARGRYTDIDTLIRRDAGRTVRPGSYTGVDTLAGPASGSVRPGSYTGVDILSSAASVGRPGSYTDTTRSAR